jgi:hypothetical protein
MGFQPMCRNGTPESPERPSRSSCSPSLSKSGFPPFLRKRPAERHGQDASASPATSCPIRKLPAEGHGQDAHATFRPPVSVSGEIRKVDAEKYTMTGRPAPARRQLGKAAGGMAHDSRHHTTQIPQRFDPAEAAVFNDRVKDRRALCRLLGPPRNLLSPASFNKNASQLALFLDPLQFAR